MGPFLKTIFIVSIFIFQSALARETDKCGSMNDMARHYVRIGDMEKVEISPGKRIVQGRFRARLEEEKIRGGGFTFVDVLVAHEERIFRPQLGDYIYFISPFGKILGQGKVDTTFGIESLENLPRPIDVQAIADQSYTVVVITSTSNR